MLESLLDSTTDRFEVERDELSYAFHGGTRGPTGFVTVRIYESGEPVAICRIARTHDELLYREWEKLQLLERLLGDDEYLSETRETPIALETVENRPVLFKEFLSGEVAYDVFASNRRIATTFLRNALRWLVRFHGSTTDRHVRDPTRKYSKLAERVTDPGMPSVKRFIDADDLFLGPTHGDFDGTNILLDDEYAVTGVIDFEYFTLDGVPLVDLMKLVLQTGRHIFGDLEAAVEGAFFRNCRFSRSVGAVVDEYCARLDVDRSDLLAALPMYPLLRLGPTPETDHSDKQRSAYRSMHRRLVEEPFVWE